MENQQQLVAKTLGLIRELKDNYPIVTSDSGDPLLYTGVAGSDIIKLISPTVEKYFGQPYKPAGKSSLLKNMTDSFSKAIGGMRKEQTVYRKSVSASVHLYCAFWPWGSNPVKTTVRVGLVSSSDEPIDKDFHAVMNSYLTSSSK